LVLRANIQPSALDFLASRRLVDLASAGYPAVGQCHLRRIGENSPLATRAA
jgi:hypothetical protein